MSFRGRAHALHRGVHVANELTARRHDFTDLRRRIVDRRDRALDAIERRRRVLGHLARVAHARGPGTDRAYRAIDPVANASHTVGNLLRRLVTLIGEQSHFFRDHGEATSIRAGARGLDRRVEREQVRLRCDAADQRREVVDGGRRFLQLANLRR